MPEEDRKEPVDRELIELLNELRVALPGIQLLFAFLLILPFQQGFETVNDLAQAVYFAGLAASAIAIAFLIAPATYHGLNLRRGVAAKDEMLFTAVATSVAAGLGALMVALLVPSATLAQAERHWRGRFGRRMSVVGGEGFEPPTSSV